MRLLVTCPNSSAAHSALFLPLPKRLSICSFTIMRAATKLFLAPRLGFNFLGISTPA